MPISSNEGKEQIGLWLKNIIPKHHNILDIGTGKGLYSYLFKKYDNLKECEWTGIEVWKPYVEKYNLNTKYDSLIVEDARNIAYDLNKYDVAFCGDVLEHMTKKEAVSLVSELLHCCCFVIISIPIVYFYQDAIEGNPYEKHIKVDWSHQEVMESFDNIVDYKKGNITGVYKLEGLV
jgi:SAM-dependent methyltransferase